MADEKKIDMSDATKSISRKGKEILKKVVMTVEVPEEFKGKFLMLDSKTGEVTYVINAPMSEEQKKAKAQARINEMKKKWAVQIDINKKANAEIDKLRKDASALLKEIGKDSKALKDVSAKQERYTMINSRIAELRAKKKSVPKKFK